MHLPTELIDLVIDQLDNKSIKNLRLVNRRTHEITTPRIWRHLVIICGLQTQQQYESLGYVSPKIFNKPGTLVVDVNNVSRFVQDAVVTMPAVMKAFKTLTLVQFHTATKQLSGSLASKINKDPASSKSATAALLWLVSYLHLHICVDDVKVHCEPIDSPMIQQFRQNFVPTNRVRMKYTLLPFREYLDDVPTAYSISVYWSAETAPLSFNASFVSNSLTKLIFRQDDGVSSAPFDVKVLKDMFAGCANLVKLVLQVHLVDQYRTQDWIPQSVRDLHLLGKYESQTQFNAGQVENLKICDSSRDAAMNITYKDNVSVYCV